ncbi:MAG: hypothetical protein IPM54_33400 [Polyangiaceae bacterium]|nr:hypothetical protein [Polyangiaceae bacterium]
MSDTLKSLINKIKVRLGAEDPAAFDDMAALAEQYPDEPDVWRALAYAYEVRDDYTAAIAAITREMDLRPERPALYFTRGGYLLMTADYEGAVADFTKGLVLGDQMEHEPYREVLHFLRAEAFFQLGRKAEARSDLEHVKDDCVFWTIQVRSKAELLALCAESAR